MFLSSMAMTLILATLMVGPGAMDLGLKSDIPFFDVLKSMPFHGPQLIFGEIIVPFVILSGVLLLGFLLAMVVGGPLYSLRLPLILPMLLGIIGIRLTTRNLLMLYLPDISNLNNKVRKDPILASLVNAIALILSLIPPVIAGGLAFGIGYLLGLDSFWLSAISIGTASLALFLEALLLICLSESRYQNFDISQENTTR